MSETMEQTFERWLSDGESWIGVFQNEDLGHPDIGRKVALPYDAKSWDAATVGKSRAPDHKTIGMGWRYILKFKCKTVEEALEAMKK